MRKYQYLLFSLLSIAFLASCGKSYKDRQRLNREQQIEAARQDSAALKIATVPTMDCLPLFIAAEDSLFQKAGVDVRLKRFGSQTDGDTLLRSKNAEGIVTDLVKAEHLRHQGIALKFVTSTNTSWQLISNRIARVAELKQLSDKMVAIAPYSATQMLADMAIDSARTKEKVYRIEINDVNVRLKMILNNEIDAAILPEPQATQARLFQNPVLMDSRDKNLHLGVIAFRQKVMENKDRKQQIKKFLQVYDATVDSINKHGVKHYGKIICKYMGVDMHTVNALPTITYHHATSPRPRDIARGARFTP